MASAPALAPTDALCPLRATFAKKGRIWNFSGHVKLPNCGHVDLFELTVTILLSGIVPNAPVGLFSVRLRRGRAEPRASPVYQVAFRIPTIRATPPPLKRKPASIRRPTCLLHSPTSSQRRSSSLPCLRWPLARPASCSGTSVSRARVSEALLFALLFHHAHKSRQSWLRSSSNFK